MKGQVLHIDDPLAINMLLYPQWGERSMVAMENHINSIPDSLREAGSAFYDRVVTRHRGWTDWNVIERAKTVIRDISNVFQSDNIYRMSSLSQLRTARPVMQNYVMAEPSIRRMYHRNMCDGFSQSYFDTEPGRVGEDHSVYRSVMNGIVETEGTSWKATTYFDGDASDSNELTFTEQSNILEVWHVLRAFQELGEDPTDLHCGKLK